LADSAPNIRSVLRKEAALLVGFVFIGLVVLPIAIYAVGLNIFGTYGGAGYGGFYSDLSGRIRSGDLVAWFLVLSPYLGWQTLRLIGFAWRATSRPERRVR